MASRDTPVIVVTGASKGIGLATAACLLQKFSSIVVAISRTRTPELTALLEQYPSTLLAIQADVADEPAIRNALNQALETYQRIDGLVLNAGVLDPVGKISDPDNTVQKWRKHFEINFFTLLYTIQAALPALRSAKNGGRIICISSGAAVSGTPAWGAYNASKAAMNSLCRTMGEEEPGIVTIALRPGMVDTDMQATLREIGPKHMGEEIMKKFVQAYNEGKLVKPEDAGHVAAALSLSAPKSLSGKFISWDSDECREFRR